MKILKIEVEGLILFENKLDITFITEQNVRNTLDESITKIFTINKTDIYINNSISFVGVNASGKTTILNVISFVFNMMNNLSINTKEKSFKLSNIMKDRVTIKTFFYNENSKHINLLKTIIKKEDNILSENNLMIEEETLYKRNLTNIRTKGDMFNFEENHIMKDISRNILHYLPNDISIITAINKENKILMYLNTNLLTNFNILILKSDVENEIIHFLDNSIEYLKVDYSSKIYKLKFKNSNEIIFNDSEELERYLSSGTIKGATIFKLAMNILKEGGYLIIDELENHFNKSIACALIDLFNDKRINKFGAVLLFSTHYIEILDTVNRNDSINVVTKESLINVNTLSSLVKRNDYKVSEYILSSSIAPTMPSYEKYMNLKKAIVENIGKDK